MSAAEKQSKADKLQSMLSAQNTVINLLPRMAGARILKKSEADLLHKMLIGGQEVVLDGIVKLKAAHDAANGGSDDR